ncbi:MAG: anti-sigma factor [Actinobacteria bacterium]|nr:anti-sigma factor [Actinomycetota bacterium]
MEHEAIEELLAGYVLRALSGEDAREADRLLSEHVPACSRCREALGGFQEVAGELGLGAPPVSPPEVLLPRLHRELGEPSPRRRSSFLLASAASFVLIVGLAGLAVSQNLRANHLAQRASALADLANFSRQPDTSWVPVGPVTAVARPGVQNFYIEGHDVPDPAPGTVYHLWLVSGGQAKHIGWFRPEGGFVVLELALDPNLYDEIVITEQPEGVTGGVPQNVRWRAPV